MIKASSAITTNANCTKLEYGSGTIRAINETLCYTLSKDTFVVFSTIHGEEADVNITASSAANPKNIERFLGLKMKNAVFFEANGIINITAVESKTVYYTAYNASTIVSLKANKIGFISGKTSFFASSNKDDENSVSMKLKDGVNAIFVERNPEHATINNILATGNVTLMYFDVNGISINESNIINASNFVVVANLTGKKSNGTISISIAPSQENEEIYYKYTISTSTSSKIVKIDHGDEEHDDHNDHKKA